MLRFIENNLSNLSNLILVLWLVYKYVTEKKSKKREIQRSDYVKLVDILTSYEYILIELMHGMVESKYNYSKVLENSSCNDSGKYENYLMGKTNEFLIQYKNSVKPYIILANQLSGLDLFASDKVLNKISQIELSTNKLLLLIEENHHENNENLIIDLAGDIIMELKKMIIHIREFIK